MRIAEVQQANNVCYAMPRALLFEGMGYNVIPAQAFTLVWLSCASLAVALDAGTGHAVELRLRDGFSGTFPDTTTVWRVEVRASVPVELTWELTLGNAVVDRGLRTVSAVAKGCTVPLPVRLPALREGVTAKATLAIRARAAEFTRQLEHPVWILPKDPWEGLRTRMGENIAIAYDRDDILTDLLHSGGFQTIPLRTPAAILERTGGLIVVGEGLALQAQRGLVDALLQAAARGARVLMLAPAGGAVPVPGHMAMDGAAPTLRLEGIDALRRLNRHLDLAVWPGAQAALASTFALSAARRQVEVVWQADTNGYAWLDADFRARSGGRFLAVGWAPAGAWDTGPAPRHTLATLMRFLLELPTEP